MTQVQLSLSEIYKVLCPACQGKLVKMVQDKLTTQSVVEALEGKPPDSPVRKEA